MFRFDTESHANTRNKDLYPKTNHDHQNYMFETSFSKNIYYFSKTRHSNKSESYADLYGPINISFISTVLVV